MSLSYIHRHPRLLYSLEEIEGKKWALKRIKMIKNGKRKTTIAN